MYPLTAIPLFSLAAANLPVVPNPQIIQSIPFPGNCRRFTQGTISVISERRTNTPTSLIIEFQPIKPTEFPFENAPRTIRIDLRTGLGTITRASYTEANGNTVPAATIEICSDALSQAEHQQLNSNGRRVYSLLASGLGQVHAVSTSNSYYDIWNLPIIQAYYRHGNNMQGGQFEAALRTLSRTLRE